MGDILFLAHRLPYPPDRGDRIRSWHVLNALAKFAPVHVCALTDDDREPRHVAAVKAVAASVVAIPRVKSKAMAVAQAMLTGMPASVVAFDNRRLHEAVSERVPFVDTIYAFSSQMAAYVPHDFAGRFVMDFVDMDSAKFAALGFVGRVEAKRLLAWEVATAKRANCSIFISASEAALFSKTTGLSASVMGNGIDIDRFAPDVVTPRVTDTPVIVFTGQMDYAPNVEAVIRFALTVLPEICKAVPGVRFAIVGRSPPPAVKALASDTVIVTGEVDDTRPWLAAASLVVAPLAIARGVQNKILEAMAMGRACVVSLAAATGIDARDGRDFVVAEQPGAPIIELLRDPARCAAIGRAARAQMVAAYQWDMQLAPLARFIGR